MTAITDGLVTELDRVTMITATLECQNPVTIRCMVLLALKMGVCPKELALAAETMDQSALKETGPAAEVRMLLRDLDVTGQIGGMLSECG